MSKKPAPTGESEPPPYNPNAPAAYTATEKQPLQKYGNTQHIQPQQQTTQFIQQPAPQIIYVQQPPQIQQNGIPTTTQPVVVQVTTEQVPFTTAGTNQTTAGTNSQYIPTDSDYKASFQRKLHQPKINCGCECCNLWIAVHVWLILYIIFVIIQIAIVAPVAVEHPDESWLWVLVTWYIIYVCVNIWCLYGLYHCQQLPFLVKLISLGIDAIFTIISIIFVNYWAIIDLILICYAFWVFWKVWKWAQYFEKGGVYNEFMVIPGVVPQSTGN